MRHEPLRFVVEDDTIVLIFLKSFKKIVLDFRTKEGEKFPWGQFLNKSIEIAGEEGENIELNDAAKVCFFMMQMKESFDGMNAQELWESAFFLGGMFERVRKNREVTLTRSEVAISAQDIHELDKKIPPDNEDPAPEEPS